MDNPHARLLIETGEWETKSGVTILDLKGCMTCLTKAITTLLVNDPEFRIIINTAGREANRIRMEAGEFKKPQQSKPVDPTKN